MRRAVPLLFLVVSCAGPTPLADGGAPTDAADVTDGRPTPPPSDAGTPSDAGLGEDAGPPPSSDCPPGEGRLVVTEVRGSIEDGAEIVVCGDLFGAQGPNILLFDDMEGREGGAAVAADDPVIGAWTDPGGLYADDAGRSGSGAMVVNDTTDTGGRGVSSTVGLVDPSGRFGLRHFDEVFLHLSIRDLGDFPGNGSSPTMFSSDSSAKDVWMMFGGRGDNYEYSCRTECNGHDLVFATHTGRGSFKTDGNNTRSRWWLPDFWQFQQWNTMSTYLRIDPERPYEASRGVFEHVAAGAGYTRSDYEGQILQELAGLPPVWDRLKVGAWYRGAGDVRRVVDDVYIAIGPGAAARVEIANAPRIEDATRVAVSTAHGWSSDRIEATVRLGDLDRSEPLYLFVVTADAERSAGSPLTL